MGGSVHPSPPVTVLSATRQAIEEARLPLKSAGAVAVLLRLAEAIDNIDEGGLNPAGKLDNVSVPTYLRYCEALGLMGAPAGSSGEKPAGGGAGGTAGRRQRAAQRRGLSAVS